MERRSFIKRFFGHLRTVLTHKRWVFHFACKLGIPWRGIIHDLSKFHPVEFFEGVRYWTGKGSPITECKKVTGVSKAWLHHKGRNRHHFQYWMDYANGVTIYCKMPFKDVLELLADWYGAAVAYSGNTKDLYTKEWDWWLVQRKNDRDRMNPETYHLINYFIWLFCNLNGISRHFKENLEKIQTWYESGKFVENIVCV